jgi:hypothetical protein
VQVDLKELFKNVRFSSQVTEISAISGRNLREIVTSHFWRDSTLMECMGRKNATLCRDCHSLLEQGPILQNSLSAEIFSETFTTSN